MPLSELYDPNAGYLVNDTVVVEAEIRLKEEQEEEGKRGDEAKMWLYTIVKEYFAKRVWYTSAISAFLDLAQEITLHISPPSSIDTSGGITISM
ncbi:hypothetical protein C1H46_028727 [Malus baccata]|uniref:MATH domain-containing protein n=1 Tax=Malus baccata TaxID=106549 RepID=A0A540LGT2_MALBA|nr:hypothetical protein C1H46_028727 [Malus baccata]